MTSQSFQNESFSSPTTSRTTFRPPAVSTKTSRGPTPRLPRQRAGQPGWQGLGPDPIPGSLPGTQVALAEGAGLQKGEPLKEKAWDTRPQAAPWMMGQGFCSPLLPFHGRQSDYRRRRSPFSYSPNQMGPGTHNKQVWIKTWD